MARRNRNIQSSTASSVIAKNPKVVAFVCNWLSKYKKSAIDATKKSYSTNVKFLRVMCASRIDRAMVLKCVQEKVDGIFIGICNSEKCQYPGAIELAEQRFENTIEFLNSIGYHKSRVCVYEDNVVEGNSLIKALEEFAQKIKQLGSYSNKNL